MSVYVNPIANGIMASSLIIYIAFIPLLIHEYRKYGTVRMRGNIVIASFIIYMITAWFMTVMPLPSFEAVNNMNPIRPNFKPFLFIDTFISNNPEFSFIKPRTWFGAIRSSSFFTVAFNVVLTIPFGVYLRKYFKLSLPWVAVLGLLLSLFYEITQYTGLYGLYPKAYRFADVDDLIVNTFGAVVGYFFAGCIEGILPNPAKDREIITEKASLLRRLLSFLVDSIVTYFIFNLTILIIFLATGHRVWELLFFLASEAIVFLIIPLLTKNKQTIGMWLHFIYGMDGMLPIYTIEMIFQLLFMIWLFTILFMSVRHRKVCYYWETWFDTYLKAHLPNHELGRS